MTSFEDFFTWYPYILALKLEADLVEWAVKVFVSMSAIPNTSIMLRDNVEVEIAL